MKIRQVMTSDVVCCVPSDSAQRAASLMGQMDVGVIPVVESDDSKKLVGLVTDRDLCLSVVAAGSDPDTVRLEDCMSQDPVCCDPEDDIEDIIDLMQTHQVRRIPVVNSDQEIQGIVSVADLALTAEDSEQLGEVIKTISEPSEP